jgi:hypothetical protein
MPVKVTKRSDQTVLRMAGRAVIAHPSSSVVLAMASRAVVPIISPLVVLRQGNENDLDSPIILLAWAMASSDEGVSHARVLSHSCTLSESGTLQFSLYNAVERKSITLPWSSPDQVSPHETEVDVTDSSFRGLTYQIRYRAAKAGEAQSGSYKDLAYYLYVPEFGGSPDTAP